jgi:hypothetical protein
MNSQLDQETLLAQCSIIDARKNTLVLNPDMISGYLDRLNERTLETLARISKFKLQPCLIQRNSGGYVAAYLIQRVGDGGYRYLFRGADWKISRAKKSAGIIKFKPKDKISFENLIQAQEAYYSRLREFVGSNGMKNNHV